jgi:HK97 family phage portal protein
MLQKYIQKFLKPREAKSNLYDLPYFLTSDYLASPISSYKQNVIVHRCVNLISQTASHIPWKIFYIENKKRVLSPFHTANRLLKNPSSNKGGADFFVEVIASKLLYGNSYILATGEAHTPPKELFVLNSNNTDIIIENAKPVAYRYNVAGKATIYPINPVSQISRVLHLKNYHPTDPIYGMSCLDAASISIEVHTRASQWNSSLLQNGARPSGALMMRDPNSYLSDEQFERLQEQFYKKYTGMNNIGRPLLLEGGLEWKEMSISPKDMDFIESKNAAAREIALSFGVPPQLLGISGDNTYSNMQEARLALWEETLIPLLDKIADSFSNWFSYLFNEDILVDFDRDSISALTEKRENIWGKISSCNFMTINEKRALAGLGPIAGGNKLQLGVGE